MKIMKIKKSLRSIAFIIVWALLLLTISGNDVSAEEQESDLLSTSYQGVYYDEDEMSGNIYITKYEQEETDTDLLVVMPSLYDTESGYYYSVNGIKDNIFKNSSFSRVLVGITTEYMIGRDAFYGTSLMPSGSAVQVDDYTRLDDEWANERQHSDEAVEEELTDVAPYSMKFVSIADEACITDIGNYAFSEMKVNGAMRFLLPIKNIDNRAFMGIRVYDTLQFNDIDKIGERAFQRVTIHDLKMGNVDTIDDYAFYEAFIHSLDIENFRILGDYAFAGSFIGKIELPDRIEKIGSSVFKNCGKLTDITLPKDTQTTRNISEDAFPDSSAVTIHLPAEFHEYETFHLENYKNVIYSIDDVNGENAEEAKTFMEQHGLFYKLGEDGEIQKGAGETLASDTATSTPEETPVTNTNQETPLNTNAPNITPETPVSSITPPTTPATSAPVQTTATAGKQDKNTSKPKKGDTFSKGSLTYKILSQKYVTVTGKKTKNSKHITIPEKVSYQGRSFQVTQVEKSAFRKDSVIESIHIGNRVIKVGDYAFGECRHLKKITFGKSLKTIGKKAMFNNHSLTSIRFTGKKLKTIGKKAFHGIPKNKVHITSPNDSSVIKRYTKLINAAG